MSEEEKEAIERIKMQTDTTYEQRKNRLWYDIKILLNLIEKQQKEIEELDKDNKELRRLRNKLSIATAMALNGKQISVSQKTMNELNNMFQIEMKYRPLYDDYIFYAR